MRLAKLFITLAFALGGSQSALAAALLCAHLDCRAADARAARPAREPHPAGHHSTETHSTDKHSTESGSGHCAALSESPRAHSLKTEAHAAAAHNEGHAKATAARDGQAEAGAAPSDSSARVVTSILDAPARSSCEHCFVSRPSRHAAAGLRPGTNARDADAGPPPAPQRIRPPAPAPSCVRLAPTRHAPPPGRPLHLLNSVLLI